MLTLFQLLETVAPTDSTILVTGETGTGKEMVARAIHHNSPRRASRFVAINCSAIPETLLEAELFGHVRGAFTGAVGSAQGRFEQAHKGTLFLDEVGTMSAGLQMKLLRVLQEREFERVGESLHDQGRRARHRRDQLRISRRWCARARSARTCSTALNVIPVRLPPLRERREDIPLLVQHFLEIASGASVDPPRAGRHLLAAGGAAADGLRVARQRPAARELRRAGDDARRGTARRSTSTCCPTRSAP